MLLTNYQNYLTNLYMLNKLNKLNMLNLIKIILVVSVFSILAISLFEINKQKQQLIVFLGVFICFLIFSLIFNYMVKKNKNNSYGNNSNYTYHLTKINNNYEDIDKVYDQVNNLFSVNLERLLNSSNNKITNDFIDQLKLLKHSVINNTKKNYKNNLSNNTLKTINNNLDSKIKLFESLKDLDKDKIVFDENSLENLIFNMFYELLNNSLNDIIIIDSNFINNLKHQKNNLINDFKQKYIYTNFEDHYKDNKYSKDFLNNYYESLKKIDFKLDKEIEKLKEIYRLNKNINKKIIPNNLESIKFNELLNKNYYNDFNNDCTNDGTCIINTKFF